MEGTVPSSKFGVSAHAIDSGPPRYSSAHSATRVSRRLASARYPVKRQRPRRPFARGMIHSERILRASALI